MTAHQPKPLAYDAYQDLADPYAAHIATKPHNAYYDRPSMVLTQSISTRLSIFQSNRSNALGRGSAKMWSCQAIDGRSKSSSLR